MRLPFSLKQQNKLKLKGLVFALGIVGSLWVLFMAFVLVPAAIGTGPTGLSDAASLAECENFTRACLIATACASAVLTLVLHSVWIQSRKAVPGTSPAPEPEEAGPATKPREGAITLLLLGAAVVLFVLFLWRLMIDAFVTAEGKWALGGVGGAAVLPLLLRAPTMFRQWRAKGGVHRLVAFGALAAIQGIGIALLWHCVRGTEDPSASSGWLRLIAQGFGCGVIAAAPYFVYEASKDQAHT